MTNAAALDFDHVELLIGTVENAADANAKAVRNTVLSPRFYTLSLIHISEPTRQAESRMPSSA